MLSKEEYSALKAADLQAAEEIVAQIKASTSPAVRYKESRPIMDIKHMIETSAEIYGDHTAFYQNLLFIQVDTVCLTHVIHNIREFLFPQPNHSSSPIPRLRFPPLRAPAPPGKDLLPQPPPRQFHRPLRRRP